MPLSHLQPAAHPQRELTEHWQTQRKVSVKVSEKGSRFRSPFTPRRRRKPTTPRVPGDQGDATWKFFRRTSAFSPRCARPAAPSAQVSGSAMLAHLQGWSTLARGGGRATSAVPRDRHHATRSGPELATASYPRDFPGGTKDAAQRPPSRLRAPAPWRRSRDASGSRASQWERTSWGDADVALPRWRRVRREQPCRGEASKAE
jgi:hypothetical protein